jgi:hypothetical protein
VRVTLGQAAAGTPVRGPGIRQRRPVTVPRQPRRPIAGDRDPPLAGLDELDLVRVEAAHGRGGHLTARRAGRVGLFHHGVQRSVFGIYLGQGGRTTLPGMPPTAFALCLGCLHERIHRPDLGAQVPLVDQAGAVSWARFGSWMKATV